jgi:catechol 2,3-dioxygenase-like lactoylglutathione lyase family enzyme
VSGAAARLLSNPVPALTHIALHVRDLDACVAFYREFCGLVLARERHTSDGSVVWLAEPGRERELIFVLLPGGPGRDQSDRDFGHLGFACGSRAEVDEIAARGREAGCLAWPPREEPYPVGYYCGLRDPDGQYVEFSYGQPLGPGAADA